jgi:hypothetical protein
MAQVVEAYVPEPDALGRLGEGVRDRVGVDGPAVAPVHDEALIPPRLPAQQATLRLLLPVTSERGDRRRWQRDRPSRARCLALTHPEHGGLEVDVLPPKAHDLAAAHTGGGRQEHGELVGRPLGR